MVNRTVGGSGRREREAEFYYAKETGRGRREEQNRKTESGKEKERKSERVVNVALRGAQHLKAGNFHLRNCY